MSGYGTMGPMPKASDLLARGEYIEPRGPMNADRIRQLGELEASEAKRLAGVERDRGLIDMRLEAIGQATDELSRCLNRLESRIGSVLRPEGPQSTNDAKDAPRPAMSEVSSALSRHELTLGRMIGYVNAIADRVEL